MQSNHTVNLNKTYLDFVVQDAGRLEPVRSEGRLPGGQGRPVRQQSEDAGAHSCSAQVPRTHCSFYGLAFC
jgi:hypothetical protein